MGEIIIDRGSVGSTKELQSIQFDFVVISNQSYLYVFRAICVNHVRLSLDSCTPSLQSVASFVASQHISLS